MSSTYRILCMSHDPATAHGEWNRPEDAEAALAAGIDGHPHCDLLVGRYSYPLVEVGCPPTRDQPAKLTCGHNATIWVDAGWLRLLAVAQQSSDAAVQAATKGLGLCWPMKRIRRLGDELGVPRS
ncbi:hypothetical protein ACIO3R_32265 [Streptomyces sp. NPDC087428]|uniref:hypothetical protein n=1 Tax=Streptomyces sp. NPDC087428 TaxID=3365788 RepID=UPI0038040F41